jgi:hypothetical protein
MKSPRKISILTLSLTGGLLSIAAAAQTAGGAASGNVDASVAPGHSSAGAGASQSVQAPGASANASANASAQAQTSHEPKAKSEPKHDGGKSSSGDSSGGARVALSSGANLQAEFTKPVDAKKAKTGDPVEAKVTQDVKENGKVVIHKGSRLVGHVTEAKARTKDQASSTLGIAFDKAVLKGGEEMSFASVIQAIAPPVRTTINTAADENAAIAGGGAPMPSGPGARMPGGGVVGGVTSTAGGAVSGATGTVAGTATGAATTTVSGATRAAGDLTAQGQLTNASQGAIGLEGLVLNTPSTVMGSAQGSAQGSLITSTSRNVRLEGGTQVLLRVTGSAQ